MKVEISHIKNVYFVGIGGIGMSGLARYFHTQGCQVYGYDRVNSPLTQLLQSEGISIVYEDQVDLIPFSFKNNSSENLVVYTPAVPQNMEILQHFRSIDQRLFKRSEVLGLLSEDKFTIAIAGTHGKTTTSSLVAHLLKDTGYDCSAFLGGISANYDSNVLFGNNDVLVVEADEYDRSFLTLHPDLLVVTSLQADHLDIYGDYEHIVTSFKEFLDNKKENGWALIQKDVPLYGDSYYSLEAKDTAIYAKDLHAENGHMTFTYVQGDAELTDLELGMPGLHNIENALAAIAIARKLGIEDAKIRKALKSFKGVKRRFEKIVDRKDVIYIDDYAHHPEVLRALLKSLKVLYPERAITLVFQPHLYSRTRDFGKEFAQVLSQSDDLWLLDIYPAREEPIEGITSSWLLNQVSTDSKRVLSKEQVLEAVKNSPPELLVTAGAGDVDRLVLPLKEILKG